MQPDNLLKIFLNHIKSNPRLPIGLFLLLLLPLVLPNYYVYLLTSIIITSLITLSVGLVTGMAGMVTLCQLSFAGIGGWVVAFINANNIAIPFGLQVFLAGLVAVPIGILIGLPALRVRGVNLAVVTFGFAAITDLFFTIINFPGGVIGKPVLRPDFLSNDKNYYWFCLLVVLVIVFTLQHVYSGRLGSAWLAVKHSERAAAALGLNVPSTKLWAFAVSAFVAGVGGGLLAGQLGLLSASNFAPVASLVAFAAAVMVGARYPEGAILAGAMSVLVPEILSRLHLPQDLGNIIFAVGTVQALKDGGGVFEVIARKRKPKLVATSHMVDAVSPSNSFHDVVTKNLENILELKNLCVSYGAVKALDNINLNLPNGQVLGLIGPNGAGKSSLIDAITGFTNYDGDVILGNANINGLSATARARVSLRRSFQQDRTIPELNVHAYLELAAGKSLDNKALETAQEFSGIANLQQEIHSLDVGRRRLLEVAGVLAAQPKVILLDEPAAGLSGAESFALAKQLHEIPKKYDCAVLLVEHDMDVVRAACDQVVVLDFGKLIAFGETEKVLARPDVIAAYLGAELPEVAEVAV